MSQGAARTEGARFGQRRRFYTPAKPPPHATRRTRRGPRGVVSSVLGPPPAPPHPLPQPAAPLAPVAGPRGVSRATPQHALVWLAPSLARVALRSVHASCPQDSSFLFAGWSSVLRWRRNSSLSIHPLVTSGSFQLLALAGDASVATPCVDTAFHLSWVNTEERSGWVTWQVCVRLSQKPPDRVAKRSSRVHLPTSRVPAFPSSWQGFWAKGAFVARRRPVPRKSQRGRDVPGAPRVWGWKNVQYSGARGQPHRRARLLAGTGLRGGRSVPR